jgi:hypothetical protein
MITKSNMMDVLLAASPTFASEWEAFQAEWADETDLPLYIALSGFARHVIAFLAANDEQRHGCIFDAVERLHVEGDAYVREAATVGLLEDLQNGNLHHQTDPEQFRRFLRPVSREWWDRLNAFWNGVSETERLDASPRSH